MRKHHTVPRTNYMPIGPIAKLLMHFSRDVNRYLRLTEPN